MSSVCKICVFGGQARYRRINGHSEHILLAVTQLRKQSMILGFTWLNKHNPEIDFRAQTVKMTRCLPYCCSGCQAEHKEEQNSKRQDAQQINACQTGLLPTFVEDADEDEDKSAPEPLQSPSSEPEMFLDELLKEGDQIWATGLFPQAEQIQATSTVSQ